MWHEHADADANFYEGEERYGRDYFWAVRDLSTSELEIVRGQSRPELASFKFQ